MKSLNFIFPTDLAKYYNQVLTILKPIPPFNSLRKQEIFILGWLMYYYNKLKKTTDGEEAINSLLFSIHRVDIISKLITDDEDGKGYEKAYTKFSNILVSLRKKGFILSVKNKDVLNKKFILNPDTHRIEFNFKF